MTHWTAVVPIKATSQRKTRLAAHLSPADRILLSEYMLNIVLDALKLCSAISTIATLSESATPGVDGWFADHARGLNAELDIIAGAIPDNLLVVHADLPALTPTDVHALILGACDHSAIAPDRHGQGTNALALRSGKGFHFAFGDNSFAAHSAQLPYHQCVDRAGLNLDIDRLEDLEAAMSGGHLPRNLFEYVIRP